MNLALQSVLLRVIHRSLTSNFTPIGICRHPSSFKKKKEASFDLRVSFDLCALLSPELVSLDLEGPLNDIYCHHLTISAVEIQRVAGLRRVFVCSLHPRSPGQVTCRGGGGCTL